MTTESQIDPEYKRISLIASSFLHTEFGAMQPFISQRKQLARELLENWDNKNLWKNFNSIEEQMKRYIFLK